jgi:hypothetical protein
VGKTTLRAVSTASLSQPVFASGRGGGILFLGLKTFCDSVIWLFLVIPPLAGAGMTSKNRQQSEKP